MWKSLAYSGGFWDTPCPPSIHTQCTTTHQGRASIVFWFSFTNFCILFRTFAKHVNRSRYGRYILCNKIGRKVEMSRLYSVQCTQTHKHTVESRAVFCLSRISDFNICFVNVSFVKILECSYCFSCLKDLSGAKSVFWSQVKSCFHSCKGVRLPTNILTRDGHQNWNFLKLVSAHLLF